MPFVAHLEKGKKQYLSLQFSVHIWFRLTGSLWFWSQAKALCLTRFSIPMSLR